MEMSLKQSTLVLLTVAVAVISAQVTVTLDEKQKSKEEKQGRVDILFGSSLTLYCHLEEEADRFRVHWYFLNHSESSYNSTQIISVDTLKKLTNTSQQNLTDDTKKALGKYTLSNVTYNDSGWYFCEVTIEIPFLQKYFSKGAEVVVGTGKTVTEHTTYQTTVPVSPTNVFGEWWLWAAVGGSALILIVLIIIYVLMRRRQHIRELQTPIYGNMRPSPRPGAPADKLKTVSSCQNLRTPNPGRQYEESKMRYKH